MEDPDWAKIISYLYESRTGRVEAPIYELGETSGITANHPFVEELDLTRKKATDALFQANEFGFLELTHQTEGTIESDNLVFDMFKPKYPKRDSDLGEYALRLSKKGFDVAHEREVKQNQTENSQAIIILTIVLAFAAITDLAINATIGMGLSSDLLIFFPAIAIGVFTLLAIYMYLNDLFPN